MIVCWKNVFRQCEHSLLANLTERTNSQTERRTADLSESLRLRSLRSLRTSPLPHFAPPGHFLFRLLQRAVVLDAGLVMKNRENGRQPFIQVFQQLGILWKDMEMLRCSMLFYAVLVIFLSRSFSGWSQSPRSKDWIGKTGSRWSFLGIEWYEYGTNGTYFLGNEGNVW